MGMKKSAKAVACMLALVGNDAWSQPVDPEVHLDNAEKAVWSARKAVKRQVPMTAGAESATIDLRDKLDKLGSQRSFSGDSDGAMAAFDELFAVDHRQHGRSADDLDRFAAARAEDALEAIVRQARNHRIVILNEAHHVPLHRAFAMRLARELRKIGYTWLACETFETTPFGKGYLALSDGYYLREPVFAHFLRDAAAEGWKMVQYEPMDDEPQDDAAVSSEMRESGEARNLVERVFARDPNAKLLIFVGYGHLMEMPKVGNGVGTAQMAAHLKHLTGLDPLTVEQTIMMGHTDVIAEPPMYRRATAREQRGSPFVLRAPDGKYEVFGGYRFAVDIQVTHPRSVNDSMTGRPTWMRDLAQLRPVDVPKALLPQKGTRLIYAYEKDAPADAVPSDIVKVAAGATPPQFMLPVGECRYVVGLKRAQGAPASR